MKKILLGFILAVAFSVPPLAGIDLEAHVRTEAEYQEIRESSYLNPDNIFRQNDLEATAEGRIRFKTDLGENVKAMFDAAFTYSPALFDPSAPPPLLSVRELYADIQTDPFALKVGKQFLKWGSSEYFNPLDIVNVARAELDSPEAEGNFFVNLNIPIGYFLSLEALTLVRNGLSSFYDLPVIGKISFSFWQASGFLFAHYRDGKKTTWGLDFILSLPFAEGFNLALYNQTLLRFESEKKYFTVNDGIFSSGELPDDTYPAVVAGLRTDLSFATVPWLNGIKFVAEYYYDAENWTGERLRTFFDYLDLVKNDAVSLGALLPAYRPLKNSPHYLYADLAFEGLFFKDFRVDTSLVVNPVDSSFVLMPHVSYLFNNGNTVCGLRSLIYSGGERTEFGNGTSVWRLGAYVRTSF